MHLNDYINPQYLSTDSIQQLATRFDANTCSSLQLENFLPLQVAEPCSQFLSFDAHFENFYGLYKQKRGSSDSSDWLQSPEEKRFFCYEMLSGSNNKLLNKNAISFVKLRHFLESDNFLQFAKQITNRNLQTVTPVRVHRMQAEHFLKKHDDRVKTRIVAFILYLSPDWLPEYGGSLHMINHDGSEQIFSPEFNSLLMFDVNQHQHHYISKINEHCAIGRRNGRISINGWFCGASETEDQHKTA